MHCRRVSFGAPALMRHKEKRRCSPTDFYSVGAERGRAWTELRCARSLCLAREGTACTKVVLQSRVLFRVTLWLWAFAIRPSWTFAKLDGYVLAEVTSLLFDVWVVFCWFLGGGSRVAPSLPLSRGVVACLRGSCSWLPVSAGFSRPRWRRGWPSRLFLVLLVFLAFPGFCGSFSVVLSVDLLFILVLMDFLTVEVVLPFSQRFPSCGVSARWRDLPNVVLDIWGK